MSEDEKNTSKYEPIVFKPKKRRNLRQIKRTDSDQEEEEETM